MAGMIRVAALSAAAAAMAALAACGGGGSSSSSNTGGASSTPSTPAPSPPPTLTDAQKKTLLAQLPAAYQAADLSNGEARFQVCRSCHSTAQGGENMTGPNLWGIFGRKAGTAPDFSYSDDLKNAGWTWDADRLDKWITNPKAVLPNTKMTFIGVESPTDRRDIIAFLKTQTSPAP